MDNPRDYYQNYSINHGQQHDPLFISVSGDRNTVSSSPGDTARRSFNMILKNSNTISGNDDSSSRGLFDDQQSNDGSTSCHSPPSSVPLPPDKDIKDIFNELFREKNVSSSASWQFALKLIAGDDRYDLIRHHPERKQMFSNYKMQRSKEEKEEQRAKIRRYRENLEKMLSSSSLIDGNTRYNQACDLFKNNEAWKSVPDNERKDIFRDVVEELTVRERERSKETRKRNMKVLKDILDAMPQITFTTRWSEAQQLLLDNPVFAEDTGLLSMEKEDALVVFQDHIRFLEKEEEDERRKDKKMEYRQQRKNREAFISLLDQLHKQGKLTSISKWSTLYPEISSDNRFAAMLTQPLSGSTALDLFKFYVEDLRNRYEDDKEIIRDIIRRRDFEVTLETTYEEFVEVLSRDDRSEKVDAGNVKTVFERLVTKVSEREKEKQREENRKKRRIENNFLNLLHQLEPAVDDNSNWEDVRKAIADDPDFIIIPLEEERVDLFKKYIITVQESCSHHHSKARRKTKDLSPEESKSRRKRRDKRSPSNQSPSMEEEESRHSYPDGDSRRRRPKTPVDPEDSRDHRDCSFNRPELRDDRRRERLERKRDISRSPSDYASPRQERSSRGQSREDASHRKDSPMMTETGESKVEIRPKSPAEEGEERETDQEGHPHDSSVGDDESDIEELEMQRKMLLQQLAAAAANQQ